MDELIIPGFCSEAESLLALRRTPPQLALLVLLGNASVDDFLCIGRDENGQATAIVVPHGSFLDWCNSLARDQRRS